MAEDGFRVGRAFMTVDPDAEGFAEKLQAAIDEAVAEARADVPIGADLGPLRADLDEAKGLLDDFTSREHKAKLGADDGELHAKIDEAEERLDRIDGDRAEAVIGANNDELIAKVTESGEKLDKIDSDRAEAEIGANNDDLLAKVAESNAALDQLSTRRASVGIGGSGGAGGGGGEAGGGGLLGGILGGATALMPGLAGAVTGLGLLGGTGALAFGGIFKAVSAAHQASLSMSQYSQQLAATEFQDSVQIQQAQQAIGQAHMQAAQDAANSANQIIQAEQAVGQAEHGLADAQFAEQQAQAQLTEARIQARLALQQLQDQVQEAALAEQSASLAVQQAKYQQQLVDQNAYSTSLDRQQAALAVAQAEEQLKLAQQGSSNATMEASKQNRQYFDGQQQVIQAEHALKDAQYNVRNAMQQVADAVRNLTLARQNAAFTQQRDALAVQSAEQNLTNTIHEQGLALAQMKAQSPLGQFQRDMARLSAPARELVREILSMRGAWRQVSTAAQTAVAPGVMVFLRGIRSLLPDIRFAARDMGTAISVAFGQFGKQMQTPAFAATFRGLISNGVQFAKIVLPAFAGFIQELARIGGAQGAVSGLASLLAGLGHGLTGMVAEIGHYTGSINLLLTLIGRVLTATGPALGNMLGTMFKVLSPVLRFLNSPGGKPFVTLLGDILAGFLAWKVASFAVIGPMKGAFGALKTGYGFIKDLPGNIKGLWDGVSAVPGKIAGLGSSIAGFASNVGSGLASAASSVASFVSGMGTRLAEATAATAAWIAEHTAATAAFIAENVAQAASATAAFIAENAATLGIAAAIALLVTGIIYLATHWKQVWGEIKMIALDIWHNVLDPAFHGIANTALWLWHNVFDPVWHGIMAGAEAFIGGFRAAWNTLTSIFKAPVNFLITTVYDNGIMRLWNDVVNAIGLGKLLDLPKVQPLAHGGVMPGYAPGRDTIPAMLSPGEGVLTPQATRGIGGSPAINALNQHFSGSTGQSPGAGGALGKAIAKLPVREGGRRVTERPALHLVGFAGGGVAGDGGGVSAHVKGGRAGGNIVGDITGALSGASAVMRIVAALATGNTTALKNALNALVSTKGAVGNLAQVMIGVPKTLITDAIKALTGNLGSSGAGAAGAGEGGGGSLGGGVSHAVSYYAPDILRVLAMLGQPASFLGAVEHRMQQESGGSPAIVNRWDINWQEGHPSVGLMQVIAGTFARWAGPFRNVGPFEYGVSTNPMANIYAGLDYAIHAYPGRSLASVMLQPGGYDDGGWLMPAGMPVNTTRKPEAIFSPEESAALVPWLKQQLSGHAGGAAHPAPGANVNFNYFGPQAPTPQMQAEMRRDMAMIFGG